MRSFVTGGTGFIGRALIRRLLADGHEVRALARRPEALDVAPGLTPVPGELVDQPPLRAAMAGCDAVFHLAAAARAWLPDPSEFDRANIDGTRAVLQAARAAGVGRVVYTSTVMVIGPTDGFIADEDTPIPSRHLSHYQRTKAAAEAVAAEFAAGGLDVVTVAPSLVYGPGDSARRVSFNRFLHDFLRGRAVVIPGDGSQRLNVVYLDDVVEGHRLALARGRCGQRYILGGENLAVRELAAMVNTLTGHARRVLHVPFALAEFAGRLDEARARLTGGAPLLTRSSVEIYRHSWCYASDKARRELGYPARGARAGIDLTLRWLEARDQIRIGAGGRASAAE